MTLADHAAGLIAEACSSECMVEGCARLARALEALREVVEESQAPQDLALAAMAGMLRALADEAWEKGCRREAAMLREAALALTALAGG